jgi:hypothetical protein
MPGVSGVTVVTCLRAFYFCTQGCGRIERPAFPAPSVLGGQDVKAKLARTRGEITKVWLRCLLVRIWLSSPAKAGDPVFQGRQ